MSNIPVIRGVARYCTNPGTKQQYHCPFCLRKVSWERRYSIRQFLKNGKPARLPNRHDAFLWVFGERLYSLGHARCQYRHLIYKGDRSDCNNHCDMSILSIVGNVCSRVALVLLQSFVRRLPRVAVYFQGWQIYRGHALCFTAAASKMSRAAKVTLHHITCFNSYNIPTSKLYEIIVFYNYYIYELIIVTHIQMKLITLYNRKLELSLMLCKGNTTDKVMIA